MFSTTFIFYLFYYKSVILFTSYFIWIRVCYVIYTCHLIYIIRKSKNCWIFSTINPSIKRLIGSTVYRNRVKRNKNNVMETFLLLVDGCEVMLYGTGNFCVALYRNRVFSLLCYKRVQRIYGRQYTWKQAVISLKDFYLGEDLWYLAILLWRFESRFACSIIILTRNIAHASACVHARTCTRFHTARLSNLLGWDPLVSTAEVRTQRSFDR